MFTDVTPHLTTRKKFAICICQC